MTIGERIKSRRIELGLSQQALSDKIGYTDRSSITKIEKDESDISYSKIFQFASVLDVSVEYLMGLDVSNNTIAPKENQPIKEELLSIILRLSTDAVFLATVETIHTLGNNELTALQLFFDTFVNQHKGPPKNKKVK